MTANVERLINEQDQKLRESVALGVEAKNFLTSDLARYITNSAEATLLGATESLKKVDPGDTKEIMRLQNIIARYESYEAWLNELVAAGDVAYQMFLEQHAED